MLDDTSWHIDATARRVRVKTAPGSLGSVALERLATLRGTGRARLQLLGSVGDDEVLAQVEQARRVCEVAAVEQPFAVGNVVDHARLAARLGWISASTKECGHCSDSLRSFAIDAATMLCVKPARVGGLANARTIIERARALGLKVYLGGFFESPYARHVHRVLARNSHRGTERRGRRRPRER